MNADTYLNEGRWDGPLLRFLDECFLYDELELGVTTTSSGSSWPSSCSLVSPFPLFLLNLFLNGELPTAGLRDCLMRLPPLGELKSASNGSAESSCSVPTGVGSKLGLGDNLGNDGAAVFSILLLEVGVGFGFLWFWNMWDVLCRICAYLPEMYVPNTLVSCTVVTPSLTTVPPILVTSPVGRCTSWPLGLAVAMCLNLLSIDTLCFKGDLVLGRRSITWNCQGSQN